MKKYFLWSVLLVFALMLGNTSAFSQVITDKEKVVEKTVEAQIAVEPALLLLFNRPILLLRATVFKQTPEERVKFITQRFNEIVTQGNVEKVVAMRIKEGIAIGLDENPIMVITEDDIDPFSKRNLDQTVEVVVKRLENVLFLINEQKSLRYNLKAAGLHHSVCHVYPVDKAADIHQAPAPPQNRTRREQFQGQDKGAGAEGDLIESAYPFPPGKTSVLGAGFIRLVCSSHILSEAVSLYRTMG